MALTEREQGVSEDVLVLGIDPANNKQYVLPIDHVSGRVLCDLDATEVFQTVVKQGAKDVTAEDWDTHDQDVLDELGNLATQSTLQYLTDTVGDTNDAEQDDPTGDGTVIALLKGILDAGNQAKRIPTTVLDFDGPCTSADAVATANGPCRIGYVVVNYGAPVSVTATVVKPSDLGAAFDAELENLVFATQQKKFWTPDAPLHIMAGDSLVVTAPGVLGQDGSVAIYGQDETL